MLLEAVLAAAACAQRAPHTGMHVMSDCLPHSSGMMFSPRARGGGGEALVVGGGAGLGGLGEGGGAGEGGLQGCG